VIIARRPFTILDVDLLGLIALGVLILAGIWVFALPWQRTWDQYWAAAADRVATEQGIRDYAAKLERYRQELDHLQGIVDDQAQTCPDAGRFTDLLEEIAAIAEQSGIQLVSVTPKPGVPAGSYLASDVEIGGLGTSHDFVRFLDRLAQANPYQTLHRCAIRRAPLSDEPRCAVNWTMRLYTLPAPEEDAS
jgi:Tfp pilus assembly protein PilO